MHSMRNMTTYFDQLVESMIKRVKLSREGIIPTSFASLNTEPNIGPFPQYNIIVEDQPIEDVIEKQEHVSPRKFTSPIREELAQLLGKAKHDYNRVRTALENPRISQATKSFATEIKDSILKMQPSSFYEDHEQYIEKNTVPFQEITIHPESLVPEGGNAPVKLFGRGSSPLLNLNRTSESITLTLLESAELVMLKILETMDKATRQQTTKPIR